MGELLTQDQLKKLMHYGPLSGIFKWRERPVEMFKPGERQQCSCNTWNTRFANKEAGTIWTAERQKTFYLIINISSNGKTKRYYAHRLAILYVDGHFPAEQVDHIDGDGLNNRRDNLREVNALENQKNQPMQSNNTSGCVGVHWHKQRQKWQASIVVNGKNVYGGLFTNKKDAVAKRKQMEIECKFHSNHGRKQIDRI